MSLGAGLFLDGEHGAGRPPFGELRVLAILRRPRPLRERPLRHQRVRRIEEGVGRVLRELDVADMPREVPEPRVRRPVPARRGARRGWEAVLPARGEREHGLRRRHQARPRLPLQVRQHLLGGQRDTVPQGRRGLHMAGPDPGRPTARLRAERHGRGALHHQPRRGESERPGGRLQPSAHENRRGEFPVHPRHECRRCARSSLRAPAGQRPPLHRHLRHVPRPRHAVAPPLDGALRRSLRRLPRLPLQRGLRRAGELAPERHRAHPAVLHRRRAGARRLRGLDAHGAALAGGRGREDGAPRGRGYPGLAQRRRRPPRLAPPRPCRHPHRRPARPRGVP
mmetsp:Transcript_45024/g.126845  ORF Transcript_45024/g.126845 Transcript_45024/m.126845 type:complete len:338 (+) Transcript_45024:273-1286(+)